MREAGNFMYNRIATQWVNVFVTLESEVCQFKYHLTVG